MITLKKILVPTDFSDTAQRALAYARELADEFQATLHVLHVVANPHSQAWAGEAAGFTIPDLLNTWTADATDRLGTLDVGKAHVERKVRVGHPFVEIVRYAKSEAIDLIVMGTHGRGPVGHMLLGSVAEKVVRKAPCPVLTVRPPGHTFVMPTMAY